MVRNTGGRGVYTVVVTGPGGAPHGRKGQTGGRDQRRMREGTTMTVTGIFTLTIKFKHCK